MRERVAAQGAPILLSMAFCQKVVWRHYEALNLVRYPKACFVISEVSDQIRNSTTCAWVLVVRDVDEFFCSIFPQRLRFQIEERCSRVS